LKKLRRRVGRPQSIQKTGWENGLLWEAQHHAEKIGGFRIKSAPRKNKTGAKKAPRWGNIIARPVEGEVKKDKKKTKG